MVCQVLVKGSGKVDFRDVRLVLIKNTLELDEIYMSEAAVREAGKDKRIEICGDYFDIPFDEKGEMKLFC